MESIDVRENLKRDFRSSRFSDILTVESDDFNFDFQPVQTIEIKLSPKNKTKFRHDKDTSINIVPTDSSNGPEISYQIIDYKTEKIRELNEPVLLISSHSAKIDIPLADPISDTPDIQVYPAEKINVDHPSLDPLREYLSDETAERLEKKSVEVLKEKVSALDDILNNRIEEVERRSTEMLKEKVSALEKKNAQVLNEKLEEISRLRKRDEEVLNESLAELEKRGEEILNRKFLEIEKSLSGSLNVVSLVEKEVCKQLFTVVPEITDKISAKVANSKCKVSPFFNNPSYEGTDSTVVLVGTFLRLSVVLPGRVLNESLILYPFGFDKEKVPDMKEIILSFETSDGRKGIMKGSLITVNGCPRIPITSFEIDNEVVKISDIVVPLTVTYEGYLS
jgi:hypothetical protein